MTVEPERMAGTRELLALYASHLRRRHLADRTREEYAFILRSYASELDPLTATTAQIEAWLDRRQIEARARVTYVGCLAGFHRWLTDNERRTDDPTARVVRPRLARRLPRPVASSDLSRLLDATQNEPRMRLWLCLAAFEGLRVAEIAGLRWDDFDLEHRTLCPSVTKGDRPRMLPLAELTEDALRRYGIEGRRHADFVFPHRLGGHALIGRGKPMDPRTISITMGRFMRGLGVNATAHQLRHWFGTEAYRKTRDLRLVGDLLGHADLRTTAGYVALVPSEAAIEAVRGMTV